MQSPIDVCVYWNAVPNTANKKNGRKLNTDFLFLPGINSYFIAVGNIVVVEYRNYDVIEYWYDQKDW